MSSVNRWVLRSFPVFPVFTLIYMRCFHVWLLVHLPCFPCVCPLFLCLLLFAILAAPSIFPFQFVPLLQCVFHTFPCVCLLSSCIRLSCLGTSSFFTAFALPYLSFLCIRLLTHTLYFPCVPFIPVLFPLFPVAFPSSSSFVPAFSVPCSPLFPLLRFPFRKKFSLKSCMISSVKYMFYSIFLACLWKFS